ncbi:unnamed protein product [Sphagnum jensenii]
MSSQGNLEFEINSIRWISDLELAGISTSSKFSIPLRILTDVQVKIPRTALDPNAAASRAFCTYLLEYHGISSDLHTDLTPNPVQNRQLMLLCPQVDPARQQQYSGWTNNGTSCCTAGRQLVRC